jgi:Holliday junction resolvase RusA-like endonuclease
MITIHGQVPSKSNGYKIGNNRLYKSRELKDYEHFFHLKMLSYRFMFKDSIKDKFAIKIHVYFQSNRSDLDNAAKIILDCLQACGVIENDRLCNELHMVKFIDKENPRIEFEISKL